MDFADALRHWPGDGFAAALKAVMEGLPPDRLPLSQGGGHYVAAGPLTASVLRTGETPAAVVAKVGIFFDTMLAGCACGDEPQTAPAYCTLRVGIDKASAAATIKVLADEAD